MNRNFNPVDWAFSFSSAFASRHLFSPPYIMYYIIGFTICQEILQQYFVVYPLSYQHLVDKDFLCKRKAPLRMLNLVFGLYLAPIPPGESCEFGFGSPVLPCYNSIFFNYSIAMPKFAFIESKVSSVKLQFASNSCL